MRKTMYKMNEKTKKSILSYESKKVAVQNFTKIERCCIGVWTDDRDVIVRVSPYHWSTQWRAESHPGPGAVWMDNRTPPHTSSSAAGAAMPEVQRPASSQTDTPQCVCGKNNSHQHLHRMHPLSSQTQHTQCGVLRRIWKNKHSFTVNGWNTIPDVSKYKNKSLCRRLLVKLKARRWRLSQGKRCKLHPSPEGKQPPPSPLTSQKNTKQQHKITGKHLRIKLWCGEIQKNEACERFTQQTYLRAAKPEEGLWNVFIYIWCVVIWMPMLLLQSKRPHCGWVQRVMVRGGVGWGAPVIERKRDRERQPEK